MTDVYIGYDDRDEIAASVCASSIRRRSNCSLRYLRKTDPDVQKVFSRGFELAPNGQMIDAIDGKPFSTDFSFTRFLVPYLEKYYGWAIFCDPDMIWLAPPEELLALADDKYAAMVVKHNHVPTEKTKMGGLVQTTYPRKNWSSLVLWNCGHRHNKMLAPQQINLIEGSYLHGFVWLKDDEIGELDPAWNFLVGHSDPKIQPKVIHHTDGSPTFKDCNTVRFADVFFDEIKDFWWTGRTA